MTVVIWTDGKPDHKKAFVRELQLLLKLPVRVVMRLCTGDGDVVEYYSELDEALSRVAPVEASASVAAGPGGGNRPRSRSHAFDVLDDVRSEAFEVGKVNRWLTYGAALHFMREFGVDYPTFDLLDERKLSESRAQSEPACMI